MEPTITADWQCRKPVILKSGILFCFLDSPEIWHPSSLSLERIPLVGLQPLRLSPHGGTEILSGFGITVNLG